MSSPRCAGRFSWLFVTLLLVALVASCAARWASGRDVVARLEPPAGWERTGIRVYERQNLFDLVDGQAESYFVYGFQEVTVARYQSAAGEVLEVDIWRLATPEDAYGLFTAGRSGAPVAIGNGGDAEPGRRVAFWQSRYYVHVWARQKLPAGDLEAISRSVAGALPAGGQPPALVGRVPCAGPDGQGLIFFHEELSIQQELWLGGGNILGLGPETDGVLARCAIDGQPVQVLLVEYAQAAAATAAVQALEGAPRRRPVAADARGNLLGAVFGAVDEAAARALLQRALGGP